MKNQMEKHMEFEMDVIICKAKNEDSLVISINRRAPTYADIIEILKEAQKIHIPNCFRVRTHHSFCSKVLGVLWRQFFVIL